jgi:hypothetical protein
VSRMGRSHRGADSESPASDRGGGSGRQPAAFREIPGLALSSVVGYVSCEPVRKSGGPSRPVESDDPTLGRARGRKSGPSGKERAGR